MNTVDCGGGGCGSVRFLVFWCALTWSSINNRALTLHRSFAESDRRGNKLKQIRRSWDDQHGRLGDRQWSGGWWLIVGDSISWEDEEIAVDRSDRSSDTCWEFINSIYTYLSALNYRDNGRVYEGRGGTCEELFIDAVSGLSFNHLVGKWNFWDAFETRFDWVKNLEFTGFTGSMGISGLYKKLWRKKKKPPEFIASFIARYYNCQGVNWCDKSIDGPKSERCKERGRRVADEFTQ